MIVDIMIIFGAYWFLSSIIYASRVTDSMVDMILLRMMIGSLLLFTGLYFGEYSVLMSALVEVIT